MGPLREVFAKLPGMGSFADQVDERELTRVESLIHSMTPNERSRPDIIDKSRSARIARGSGRRPRDVQDLLERFRQMRDMMANLGRSGLLGRIPGMGRLAGAGGVDAGGLLGAPAASGGRQATRSRARSKSKRKQAKKARRRNRRR
jgi:signal recognition particle subunit SRP54